MRARASAGGGVGRAVRLCVMARVGLLLGALVVLGACGGRSKPSQTPSPRAGGARASSDAEQLQALLVRRDRALLAGDPVALAATSTGSQRARDRRSARRARTLPLAGVRSTAALDLAGRSAVFRGRTAYRLAGLPWRFETAMSLSAVRTAAGWRVRSALAGQRDRALWEVATYRVRRTPHFVVLVPAGVHARGLPAALESGRRQLKRALPGVAPPPRLLVVVGAGAEQARALTRSIRGVASLAAISDARVVERGPARRVVAVPAQRMIVAWPAFAALDAQLRARVITHELTHAALAGHTSGRTPAWLIEGIALYASGDRRTADAGRLLRGDLLRLTAPAARAARRAASLGALTRPDAIARLTGTAQAAAYAYASATAFTIADRYGVGALLRLYAAFNATDVAGVAGRALDDRAVRRTLGVSLPALERRVRADAVADDATAG